jgi:Repeat of unknown function (DUF5648)
LYQPNAHDYFYTTSAGEKRHAIANLGFKDEGIACYVFAKAESNTSPLYRLYKPDPYAHFYTRHAAERDKALHDFGFKDEGIACYVYETRQAGTFPFYRLFRNTSHLYTLSETEYNNDLGNGWTNEGIARRGLSIPRRLAVSFVFLNGGNPCPSKQLSRRFRQSGF